MVGCSITGCKSNSERKYVDVSFHTFPDDPQLRSAWIAATRRKNWLPKNSSRICGRHFNPYLLRKKGRKTILLRNAVPNMDPQIPMFVRDIALSADGLETLGPTADKPRLPLFRFNVNNEQNKQDVQMCRICFATGDNLHSMKNDRKLDHAFGNLTGLSVQNDDNLPLYLCAECSQQVMQCIYFKDRSLCAHILLLDVLRKHGSITSELIKNVMECQDVNAKVNSIYITTDQCDPKTVDNLNKGFDITNHPNTSNEDVNIKNKVNIDENICLTNDPNSRKEDIDIKNEVDIDEHICLTNDPNSDEEDIDIKNEIDIDEHICLRNDPNSGKEDIDIKNEVDIDENICLTSDPNSGEEDIDIKNEIDIDEHICLTNDPNSGEEDIDIKNEVDIDENICLTNDPNSGEEDIDIKKEIDHSFRQDRTMNEDAVPSSTLHEDILLGNIKVETEDGYEEESINNEDMTNNGDVGSDYTPVGQDRHTAEVSNSEVKGLLKKTSGRQNSGAGLYANLRCNMCPYKTVSDVKLLLHFKTHDSTKASINHGDDSNDNIYSCMLCEKALSSKRGLQKHLKIHSDKKPHPCKECDKSFKQNLDLIKHFRTHSGEKPFICDLCKRAFSERGNLLRHIRIHDGQKPHSCKYCKMSFNQKHHLKRHLRRHC